MVGGRQEGGIGPTRHVRERVTQHERVDVGDEHGEAPRDREVDHLDLVRAERLERARAPWPFVRWQVCVHVEARRPCLQQSLQRAAVGCADQEVSKSQTTHVGHPCVCKVETDRVDKSQEHSASLGNALEALTREAHVRLLWHCCSHRRFGLCDARRLIRGGLRLSNTLELSTCGRVCIPLPITFCLSTCLPSLSELGLDMLHA
mmetsp:Transcript_57989/g.125948  ORF Transcript_57989/g.125948 Transcript_57989/m.125948 type:complete len:204 (-) Transcript_57989:182-793(-)